MNDRIIKDAYIDKLSNMLSKNALHLLEPEIIRNMLNGLKNDIIYSIMFIDINGLKLLNDNKGHQQGDIGISVVTNAISQCIRHSVERKDIFINLPPNLSNLINEKESAFRIGGDEFLIVLKACNKDCAEIVKNRIQSSIKNLRKNNELYYLSAAIGISDTTEIDFSIIKSENEFYNILSFLTAIAEQRMIIDKNSLTDEDDIRHAMIATLNRLGNITKLNLENEDEYNKMLSLLDDARREIIKNEKKTK